MSAAPAPRSSSTPAPAAGLAHKLGIDPGDVVALLDAPPGWSVDGWPGWSPPSDRRTPSGWPGPRKGAGHVSDVGDNLVRAAALETGLVDIKVAAIGEDWSGLRFVWRRELRDGPGVDSPNRPERPRGPPPPAVERPC